VDAFIDMSSEAAGRMIFGSHRGETRMRERERIVVEGYAVHGSTSPTPTPHGAIG
jgi:hypothetical protein